MHAFVTGGTGFIGSALVARLRSDGHDVTSPSRASLDVLEPFADDRIPNGIDVLVHAAAARDRADLGEGSLVREIAMNVEATARLYEAARRRGVGSILHFSTISVIQSGADPDVDLPDDAPLVQAPTHPYALTKRWGEELAAQLRPSFAAVAIVRPGMTYGAAMPPTSALSRIAAQLREGGPYRLAPPNGHRYAPVHIDDVVDVLARVCVAPSNIALNVVGDPIHERQLVSDIAASIGQSVRFELDEQEMPRSVVPSSHQLDALFPHRRRTPWAV